MSAGEGTRKFAPATAAAGAFDLAVKNPAVLAHTVGGWIVLQIAAEQASYWGFVALLAADELLSMRFYALSPLLQQMIVAAPLTIVGLIASAVIAVTWHRFAILGETPHGLAPLSVWPTARYLGRMALVVGVGLALMVLLVPVIFFVPGPTTWFTLGLVVSLVPLALLPVILFILVRTGLAFAAAAVDDRECTLERSWHLTDGNSWRLIGGMLLALLPFYVVNGAVGAISASANFHQNAGLSHAVSIISIVTTSVGAAISAGYYSTAYSFFVGAKRHKIAEHFS